MILASIFTATCWRDSSWWVVHVPELGRSSPAARLSQVEGVARGLVATFTHEDPALCRVVVRLAVDSEMSDLLVAVAAAREDPDRVSVEAVTLRRTLARRLAAENFDVRDVAALLGLSYGRTLQLIGEGVQRATTSAHSARRMARIGIRQPAPARTGPAHDTMAATKNRAFDGHRSYRHEAVLYRGVAEFLAETVPFVLDGIALGQPVMVAVVRERLELVRQALGADAEHVRLVDMAELGGNPARIIPAWLQFVAEHGAGQRPVRGVGEPMWAGRRPAELIECQLHEALLNLSIQPDTRLWLRCPYDLNALPAAVIEEAARSHPALVHQGDYRGSTLYGGADHAGTVFATRLPEPPSPVAELHFDYHGIEAVRQLVKSSAAQARLAGCRGAALAEAVGELATNSVRHAGGHGLLRVWQEHGALVCEVCDEGQLSDPLVGRRIPPQDHATDVMWRVNQQSDLVQVRSAAGGSAVRVLSWLS